MRKNISWAKKLAIACLTGAMMIAGSVSAMAEVGIKGSNSDCAAGNHYWNIGNKITAATCTTPAQRTDYCAWCGETRTVDVEAATGHKMGDWTAVWLKEGNVNESNGFSYRICTVCHTYAEFDIQENLVKSCTAHDYTSVSIHAATYSAARGVAEMEFNSTTGLYEVTAGTLDQLNPTATCTEDGYKIEYCVNCGLGRVTVTPAKGHNIKVLATKQSANNTTSGYDLVGCANEANSPYEACADDCTENHTHVEKFVTAPLNCQAGNHEFNDLGVCKLCNVLKSDITSEKPAETEKPEETEKPSETEQPAATTSTVSSGTVVGGGIAAAGILTLITLIVKYLGSILF